MAAQKHLKKTGFNYLNVVCCFMASTASRVIDYQLVRRFESCRLRKTSTRQLCPSG
jgi:hypothetical protein